MTPSLYTLLVNAERTVMVRLWADGHTEVCTRNAEGDVWGPPITVTKQER